MDFFKTLHSRKSCRYFKEGSVVPQEVLHKILEASARSASSKNVQPWRMTLIEGGALGTLKDEYLRAFDEGTKPTEPFVTYPEPLPDEWKTLAREVGFGLFAHKGIGRDDHEKRALHYRENAHFFHASQVLILTTRGDAEKGTFLDCGMFLGSLLNGLTAEGYAACPMYFGVSYPEIIEKHCQLPEGDLLICAIPIGIAKDAHVNTFTTTRKPVSDWFKRVI
ncbi:MAG: nitroreductase family protein [Fibrobacterales bacterium]